MNSSPFPIIFALDALTGALFLLTAIGVVATRQVLASLQLFIMQSLLLTASAILLGIALGSPHLFAVAAVLVVLAYVVANPLLEAVAVPFARINLPLGIAAMFLGAFTIAVRREAVPQLLGLLALENGVFFAGVAIVPNLPVIAELAAAVDVPVITLVVGLLTRRIHKRLGTTSVGSLSALREQ